MGRARVRRSRPQVHIARLPSVPREESAGRVGDLQVPCLRACDGSRRERRDQHFGGWGYCRRSANVGRASLQNRAGRLSSHRYNPPWIRSGNAREPNAGPGALHGLLGAASHLSWNPNLFFSGSRSLNALHLADPLPSDRLSLKLRDVPRSGTEIHAYQVDRLPQAPVLFLVAARLQLGQRGQGAPTTLHLEFEYVHLAKGPHGQVGPAYA